MVTQTPDGWRRWQRANSNFWWVDSIQKPVWATFAVAALLAVATSLAPELDTVNAPIVDDWSFTDMTKAVTFGSGLTLTLLALYKFTQISAVNSLNETTFGLRDVADAVWPWTPVRD